MGMDSHIFEELLTDKLISHDQKLQEKELSEINIGAAVPVEDGLDFSQEYQEFGVIDVVGSVKDGIIGNRTNSLKTIDDEITLLKSPVAQWAKSAIWTRQTIEKMLKVGIDYETSKQDNLYLNATATIQYAGYVGHDAIKGQEGLLTGSSVESIPHNVNKPIAEMSSEEFVKLILDAYNTAWRKSQYRIQPTHVAMDAEDFMDAMQKFEPNNVVVGIDVLPISAMDRIMAALRKASNNDAFNITFIKIPSKYGRNIVKGKTRLAIYTYDANYLSMKVHMPELLPVRQRDLLTYECGYRSAFTGVMWKQPQSAVYVDYTTSKD